MILPVTDPDDDRLRDYQAVRDGDLARRSGVFVAEGREVVRRVLRASPPHRVRSVMVTSAAWDDLGDAAGALGPDVPVYVSPPGVTEAITGFNIHRGCLALVERPIPLDWREVAGRVGRGPLVILERVGNPDNIGGVFRNARALGAAGVLLSPGCSDPLYRKAIRTSMAATLDVPFAVLAPWPEALVELRARGTRVVALVSRGGDPLEHWREDAATAAGGVAVAAGHEGSGLSAEALAHAGARVTIPMTPGADSLNVSVAVAIALYELGRARRA